MEKYIAYKGFNENLECRGEKFEVGRSYSKPEVHVENLRTCTPNGWHYCDKLEEVFSWYKNNGKNRFCQIEITGNYKKDAYDKKCITTSFTIIREISKEELYKVPFNKWVDSLPLNIMEILHKLYPIHFGGSVALAMYGAFLPRKSQDKGIDLDIVTPYYIKITKEDLVKAGLPVTKVDDHGAKASGNDFDQTVTLEFKMSNNAEIDKELNTLSCFLKLDIKIDPKQAYNIVKFKDKEFRLSLPETILAAKLRYGINRQSKHLNDVYDMMGIKLK